MLILIAILLIVWLAGLLGSFTFGGWIHLLPAVAVVLGLLRLFRGRRRR